MKKLLFMALLAGSVVSVQANFMLVAREMAAFRAAQEIAKMATTATQTTAPAIVKQGWGKLALGAAGSLMSTVVTQVLTQLALQLTIKAASAAFGGFDENKMHGNVDPRLLEQHEDAEGENFQGAGENVATKAAVPKRRTPANAKRARSARG